MEKPEPLVFDHLKGCAGFSHAVFTRTGGVSGPPYDGLNVGLACGDRPEHVVENRQRILDALGLGQAIFLSQVHGDQIHVIKNGAVNPGEIWGRDGGLVSSPVTADAVITDVPDLGLVIQVADCQAVLLFDPVRKVAANVHSGWRGSVADILGQCVLKMKAVFGCRPQDILAGISPSLGPCCAEFINFKDEIPEHLWSYRTLDQPLFDFWAISRDQLLDQGLLAEHIRVMGLCTVCRTDLFFSYRAQKQTGRFAVVCALIS